MKDLLRIVLVIAVLVLIVRFGLDHFEAKRKYGHGTGEASVTISGKEPFRVAISASALTDAQPGGTVALIIKVDGRSCSQGGRGERRPSSSTQIRADTTCPERRLSAGEEHVIVAEATSNKAELAEVELIVDRVEK
jgi:hypothetical protein